MCGAIQRRTSVVTLRLAAAGAHAHPCVPGHAGKTGAQQQPRAGFRDVGGRRVHIHDYDVGLPRGTFGEEHDRGVRDLVRQLTRRVCLT